MPVAYVKRRGEGVKPHRTSLSKPDETLLRQGEKKTQFVMRLQKKT